MADLLFLALAIAMGVLLVDAVIELAFITSMVTWLHHTASGHKYIINFNGSTFGLYGKPANLLLNQGHTANAAAGTAIVLVCLGGTLILFLRSRPNIFGQKFTSFLYGAWLIFIILAFLLTLAALIYVFAVTNAHEGQIIDLQIASTNSNIKYPVDTWTPQNWYSAMLNLDFADASQRSNVAFNLRLMRGWQYNLIAMFVIQLAVTVLAVLEFLDRRKKRSSAKYSGVARNSGEQKFITPVSP
ncbi:hypothetical protein TrVFT333_003839 [Trichoderma virens FT-333]|nr:hypothetical protein TrVFT333_003839 [Trichoderma virens FT-333]